MTTKIELSRSEDFSLVRRSTSLTESCTRSCVTHYFEVSLALRIRVLVAGSQNVTSEDFSFVHRSNFVAESCTPIHRRYRACVTTWRFFSLCGSSCESGSQRVISKDSLETFCNFADLIAAISLTSSKQRFDRYDLIRRKNIFELVSTKYVCVFG